jgi:hypothetical protein
MHWEQKNYSIKIDRKRTVFISGGDSKQIVAKASARIWRANYFKLLTN